MDGLPVLFSCTDPVRVLRCETNGSLEQRVETVTERGRLNWIIWTTREIEVSGAKRKMKPGRCERKGYFKLNHVKEIQVGVQMHTSACECG